MIELDTNKLTTIAEQIKAEHRQAQEAMRQSLTHAVNCGELLIEAKSLISHGDWLAWVSDNCEFSDRTARAYMRIARNWPELSKTATVANLTYRDALALLAENKDNDPGELSEVDKRWSELEEMWSACRRELGYDKYPPPDAPPDERMREVLIWANQKIDYINEHTNSRRIQLHWQTYVHRMLSKAKRDLLCKLYDWDKKLFNKLSKGYPLLDFLVDGAASMDTKDEEFADMWWELYYMKAWEVSVETHQPLPRPWPCEPLVQSWQN